MPKNMPKDWGQPGKTASPIGRPKVLDQFSDRLRAVRNHAGNGRLDIPELAKESDLIEKIEEDIQAVGVVGEKDNAVLTYVVFTSRLLDDPGAIVTRGKTGTGKTTLLSRVARLFPDEVKIELLTMTDASMFNSSDEDHFSHKILICGERKHAQDDTTRDANRMIRQLLSEKRIRRAKSERIGNKWVTVEQERKGPVAYAESTTAGSIFEEDLNRMLQIYLDDSEEQNRAVMLATAGKYDHERPLVNVESVIGRHHAFQNWLEPCRVAIPYCRKLAEKMPAGKPESRRVIQQVLSVIESLVVLHQHHRDKDKGALIATLEDYEIARRLLLKSVHMSLGAGKDYKNAERVKAKVRKPEFTTPEVKEALGYKSDQGVNTLLVGLVNAGLLRRVREKRGNMAAAYQWAKDYNSLVLPTVQDLEG
jgi:hypothetical protein